MAAERAKRGARGSGNAPGAAPDDEPPAMHIEWRAIDSVKPYSGNPRTIPQAAIEKVAASIRAFGWRQPIVVDEDGVILVGHTRHGAARLIGSAKVPVHVAEGLTPAQAKAYRLADNRVGEETSWDMAGLKLELADLQASGENVVAPLGFDGDELDKILAAAATDEIGIPEPSVYSEQYGVIVMCADAAEQKRVYDDLTETGLKVKVVTT